MNGREPTDIIEYQQLIDGESVTLVVRREGEDLSRKVTITKAEGQPLGLSIDSAVFDRIRTCDNHCSFCFIYQLPKGMRRSLYVKDDDFRLSFLYGNYTTLTRFTEFDLERVIDEGLSPLYVSIHTTNPELRAEMLRNPRGATSLRWLSELLRAGVEVHGQVVVCPGRERRRRARAHAPRRHLALSRARLGRAGAGRRQRLLDEATMRSHTPDEAAPRRRARRTIPGTHPRDLRRASRSSRATSSTSSPGLTATGSESFESLDEAENGVGLVAAFVESFVERHADGRSSARDSSSPSTVRRRSATARPRGGRQSTSSRRRRHGADGRVRGADPARRSSTRRDFPTSR